MSLDQGGHLTHGYKVSITGKVWKQIPFGVNKNTEMIDYDELLKIATTEKPNIIVRGFSGAEVNELINGLSNEIKINLKPKNSKITDWNYVRRTLGNIAEKYLVKQLKRRPLVLPVVIEV
jgi:mRNA degradation ribonuclease J1/J2